MTRLSSYPFAKSLLALSLSAVFSSAAFASAQQAEFTDHYSVTINGEVQTTPNSAETNPLPTENQWWSTTSIRGNEIKFSAVREEEKIALVTEDVLGGYGSAGVISNNKIVTDAEKGALSLSGNILGGIANYGDDVSVKDNRVQLEGVVLGYISKDEESSLRMIPTIVGGAASTSNFTEDGPQLNVSVTGNEVIVKNAEITDAFVAGGLAQANYTDNAQTNQNRVIFNDVKSIEDEHLYVIGGRVDGAIYAQANENEVLLTDSSVSLISGGFARSLQAQANGNIVDLSNVSAQRVIGASAQSRADDGRGAQAIGNRLIWINSNDVQVPLIQFTVASARAFTGSTVVSGNQASIIGLKTTEFDDPEVRQSGSLRFGLGYDGSVGFLSESYEDDAILTDNRLTIGNSQFSDSVTAGGGSGKNVVLSGNYLNIINSQIQDLGGYFAVADDNAKVFKNIIDINGLAANQFLAFAVAGSKTVVQDNEITVENSSIVRVGAVIVQGGSFDSDGNETTEISGNRITFKNLSTPNEPSDSTRPITKSEAEFLSVSHVADVSVRDNYFEVIEVNDSRTFVGTYLDIDENIKNVDIQNNTLLVKDSTVDGVVGISVVGLGNLSEDQLKLKNNTIILDNSNVGSVYSLGQKFRSQPKQNGTLVLRGHNEVGVAPVGFNDWQFDLDTAVGNTPMLTITGTENVVLKDQTLVLNNADQANIDQISLIGVSEPNVTLTADNVTLRTKGTFAFKSMALNGDLNSTLELGQYYDTLMSQETQADVSTRTLSDSQLATVALTRQSSEEALNLLQSTENLSSDAPVKGFASLSGSSNFYEFGTGFDLNGTSLTVGGALRINDNWSGVGFANFSDANADSTVSGFRGDSDMKTYSAGVALRYQTEMPFYTEGALVVGQADTDFVGSYTNDTARYDSKRFYTTAQLGIGSDFTLSDNVNLNVYGRYSFTYLDGDKVSLNNAYNDTFDVDDTMVHAMRVGARVKGSVAPNVQWFAGAAFERVLDGDVESMVKDAKLKTETLKGNVGIFEVGATLAPNDLGPWTMDVKAGAYVGDRRGISGSVNFNYVF